MFKGTTSEVDARTHLFWGSYMFRRSSMVSNTYTFVLGLISLYPAGTRYKSADYTIRRTPVIPYSKPT